MSRANHQGQPRQAAEERIDHLARVVASSLGLEIYDIDRKRAGQRSKLVVFVSHPTRPVSLEDCESFSRQFGRELDVLDPETLKTSYELEVSSPGIERHLRLPHHWRSTEGSTVSVRYRDPQGSPRTVQGSVISIGDAAVTLRLDGAAAPLVINFDQIEIARVVFDWNKSRR